MHIKASAQRGTGRRHTDVRDACGSLTLNAQSDEDVFFLTRLYRAFTGIEPLDKATEKALRVLFRETKQFTNPSSKIIMVGRTGSTR